jgi:hypothetical protein
MPQATCTPSTFEVVRISTRGTLREFLTGAAEMITDLIRLWWSDLWARPVG